MSAATSTQHEHEEVARERVAVDVEVGLLDVVAEVGEQATGVVGGRGAVGVRARLSSGAGAS